MEEDTKPNVAFLDGQNLNLGVREEGWSIDHKKFKQYLSDKYKVGDAYYHFGFINEDYNSLYTSLQKAGFIVTFREHKKSNLSKKKGNVDTDIVFEVMKMVSENHEDFNKIVLVSGDGDYKKMVKYLIGKDKFCKILFPNKQYSSSLYNELTRKYFAYLSDVKDYIKKEKGA